MIKIISAEINSGKTTWLQNDFSKKESADGFISKKVFTDNIHIGYDIVHLPTKISHPFIRKPEHIPPKWQEAFRLSNSYSFNHQGFHFAQEIIAEAIKKNTQLIYFDEVGPLELNGKGFAQLFTNLIKTDIDIVVAVRKRLVQQVIDNFDLKEVEIFNLKSQKRTQ
jgi:nucleoside-triphosphatase THEP1